MPRRLAEPTARPGPPDSPALWACVTIALVTCSGNSGACQGGARELSELLLPVLEVIASLPAEAHGPAMPPDPARSRRWVWEGQGRGVGW